MLKNTSNEFIFERVEVVGEVPMRDYVVFLRMGDEKERRETYHRSEWEIFNFDTLYEAEAFLNGLDAGLCWMDCKVRDSLYEDCDDEIYSPLEEK